MGQAIPVEEMDRHSFRLEPFFRIIGVEAVKMERGVGEAKPDKWMQLSGGVVGEGTGRWVK